MGFKALTVNTAAEAAGHIYAEDDAAIFQSMFGGDGVLNIGNCLTSTVISNNKVRISDGVLCVGGHIGRLSYADYQDMTIENGTSGYNRNDIIYAKFLANGNVDSYTLAVKKGTATTGTATDPALLQGDLYEGATERDYPLYRVKLSGLSIASVDKLFSVIPTIPDLKAQMAKDKEEINQSLANKIPDYAHVDTLGTPTTGHVTYNISKDGFFQLHGATLATSASIFYRIRINDTIIEEGWTPNMRYGYYSSPLLPVLKGDVVKVEVDTSVAGVNYVAKLYHTR